MISSVPFIFQENKPEENNQNEGTKNLRQILDSFLNLNKRKMIFSLISALISFISFLLYLVSTYNNLMNDFLDKFDIIVFIIYLLEYSTNVILAHDRLNHMITTSSLLDLLTTTVPFIGFVINFKKFINLS